VRAVSHAGFPFWARQLETLKKRIRRLALAGRDTADREAAHVTAQFPTCDNFLTTSRSQVSMLLDEEVPSDVSGEGVDLTNAYLV